MSSTSTDTDTAAVAATDQPDEPDELVAVGRIGAPHGLAGEVFVEPWTDAPEQRFVPGAVLHTKQAGSLTVSAAFLAGGKQVVHFQDVHDRTAAEVLRGTELFIPAADRPELSDPDEFYDSDLVGLAVVGTDEARIGTVASVAHAGAATYLVVDVAGRERLIPFVRAIVPEIDVAAGHVVVDPPDGLLEL